MEELDFDIQDNRWAQVNDKNAVVNIIEWDGKTEIQGFPPKGHKLVKCGKFVRTGDTYAPIENAFISNGYVLR